MSVTDGDTCFLPCSVTAEFLSSQPPRKVNWKNVELRLVRNEFRDLFLELKLPKLTNKYLLKGIVVHKKFIKEGKATIHFQEQKLMLLISNAPTSHLMNFLKTLYVKMAVQSSEPKMDIRARLLSNKEKSVDEVSPVTVKDLNKLNNTHTKSPAPLADKNDITPTSRKRGPNDMKDNKNAKRKRSLVLEMTPSSLTDEQKVVVQAALSGKNIFFTGSAGTGKSHLLRQILGVLPPDVTVATASTGVAACQIGGITLHSFAGVGTGKAPIQQCIQQASRPNVQQGWRRCRHLIMDEISMVDGRFFEKLEHVARAVRGNDKPFGGIQLILCGDFFQLPPVSREYAGYDKNKKGGAQVDSGGYDGPATFCFQSSAWERCGLESYELQEVHRQRDPEFVSILQSIRIGRVTEEISEKLTSTISNQVEEGGILATRLCSHTKDADQINQSRLMELPGEGRTFSALDSDPQLASFLDRATPVVGELVLKVGAQVMLMKNLDVGKGLVNGARGVITKFATEGGYPVVRFKAKLEVPIKPEKWVVKAVGGVSLTRRQVPLRLAWAFSIHKSQGLTLDCVEMSLARVFEAGQAYVALSRARALKSLRIVDFNASQVRAHPDVLRFYARFRRALRDRLACQPVLIPRRQV
ncbi:ATP-dependent DNA helicase PIF1 [Ischnura elegans]|uniref:ATP-dependent DNA helicase PIF1 n=1 Tax=Ischnura elegans TaxID=197161 RepID=UPI001ED8A774|nr:ATP-dependent DNA helicase PIF1 [Ischnura elegans]